MAANDTETDIGFEAFRDHAAKDAARPVAAGLPAGAAEALADPIVQAMMAADRVDRSEVEMLLQKVAVRLAELDAETSSTRAGQRDGMARPAAAGGFAKLTRGFALALAVIAGIAVAQPALADNAPTAFISKLGDQALAVIRSNTPVTAKAGYFEQVIREDFDLSGLCRFVLGPYWRMAQPAERGQFCNLFVDDLISFYGHRLAQAGDGSFSVTGFRPDADGVVVTSRIDRPQGAPIALDWRLGVSDGLYKIEDVAIDGVSMALAQRSDIASIIERAGGQFGVLLATMREQN